MLRKTKLIALIFYILGLLYLIYTIFTVFTTVTYISSVMGSDYYATIRVSDVISVFVGQIGPFLFYTCAFFGIGYLIQVASGDIIPEGKQRQEAVPTAVDAESIPSYTSFGTPETVANDENTEPMPAENPYASDYPPEDDYYSVDSTDVFVGPGEQPESPDEVDAFEQKIADAIDDAETTYDYDQLETLQEEQKEEE